MPTITSSDGVQLNYLETGDPTARPVVLIAGFKAPATSWHYQQKPLARAGYRVIAFDRRGHGRSGTGDGPHTMDRHGADIHDLLVALELDDVTLVGQSMGGNAIWALVQQFGAGGIRDVVIVDQTPKMLNTADWPFGFYDYDEANARHVLRHRDPRSRSAPREVEGARAHLARAEGDGAPEGRQADVHRRPSSSC